MSMPLQTDGSVNQHLSRELSSGQPHLSTVLGMKGENTGQSLCDAGRAKQQLEMHLLSQESCNGLNVL